MPKDNLKVKDFFSAKSLFKRSFVVVQRARLPAGQRTLEEDLPNAAKTCFSTSGERKLSTFQIICLGLLMNIRCEIESIEGQMTNLIDDSILTPQMHNGTSI